MSEPTSPRESSRQGGSFSRASSFPPGLLADIIDLAEDAIISIDREQHIVLFNQGAERIFGHSSREVLGKALDILLPDATVELHRGLVTSFMESPVTSRPLRERSEIRGRRKDGSEFPAEASISKVALDGQTLLTVILRDITQRVAAEQKLRDSLREKEVLLREIHHRVKNNLQVISSLLGLQSRAITNEATRKAFEDSQNRIHSMALLYEMLCGSGNLSRIDLAEYTRQLAAHLFRSYSTDTRRIHLRADLEPVFLAPDAAITYGLITNELVSNALLHAFPEGRKGELHLELSRQAGQTITLSVRDDGIGLSEDDWQNATSLGFRLIKTLGKQLGAQLAIRPQGPTEIQVSFPA